MGAAKIWFMLSLAVLSGASAKASQVALAWDPNPDTNVVGYYVYWGSDGDRYNDFAYAGTNTTFTVSNLTEGLVYFFVVTAVDADGLESEPSNQVSYTVPGPIRLTMQLAPDGSVQMRFPGQQGFKMRVESSPDLVHWTVVWHATPDRDQWMDFRATVTPEAARYYRVTSSPPKAPFGVR